MSGARILVGVLLLTALLLYTALAGGHDADVDRGQEETDLAFAAVEHELAALDADYAALRSQGLVLALRDQHDDIRNKLAALKSRRVQLATDSTVDRHQRLPRFRELVDESDVLLSLAVNLHRECTALVTWRQQSQPLLESAARQRSLLAEGAETDAPRRARIETLATGLGQIERKVTMVERLIHDNVQQGQLLAEATLTELRALVGEQSRLLGH